MNTIVLLRHAKAVKDDPGGDHARSLSAGGRADAAAVGQWLRGTLAGNFLVLASDARRTRETAELAFPDARGASDLRLEADLYGASAADLIRRVRQLRDETTVVLVGHNPGIGEAARLLAATGEADALARLKSGFPTAAAAIVGFAGPWSEIRAGGGRLTGLFLSGGDA